MARKADQKLIEEAERLGVKTITADTPYTIAVRAIRVARTKKDMALAIQRGLNTTDLRVLWIGAGDSFGTTELRIGNVKSCKYAAKWEEGWFEQAVVYVNYTHARNNQGDILGRTLPCKARYLYPLPAEITSLDQVTPELIVNLQAQYPAE